MTKLERLPDWEQRLIDTANERRTLPYAYGVNDCGCFAQAAIKAVTGVTLLEGIELPRGWLAAAKFMMARGWSNIEDTMTDLLGQPMDDPQQSRRGDIVSYEEGGEFHVAVRVGDCALTPAIGGLAVIPASRWRRWWKVG